MSDITASMVPSKATVDLAPFRWLAIRAGLYREMASAIEIRKMGAAWGVFVPVRDGGRYNIDSRSGAGFDYHCGLAGKTLRQARSNVEWYLRREAKAAAKAATRAAAARVVLDGLEAGRGSVAWGAAPTAPADSPCPCSNPYCQA